MTYCVAEDDVCGCVEDKDIDKIICGRIGNTCTGNCQDISITPLIY